MRNVESESTRNCEMDRPKITTLLKHRQLRGASRREKMAPKIGREAPRDDDFSIIAKKHFFNNFQHFLTFFNMFSTYFHARNNVENIFHIFNIYRRVARRHATTQRAPKIGREAPRDDPKGT